MLISNLVLIFFKITIFSLLIIQMYQLGKQYVLPFLRAQISSFQQAWVNLQNKKKLLKTTKERITEQITTQTTQLNNLEKKVARWHKALLKRKQEKEQWYNLIEDALRKRKKQQGERFSFLCIQEEIFPDAIAQAEKELLKKCAGPEGKKYLSEVIAQLNKPIQAIE